MEPEFLSQLSIRDADEFEGMHVIQTKKVWKRFKEDVESGLTLVDKQFLTKLSNEGYSFSFDRNLFNQKFEKSSLFIIGRQDNVVGYHDAYTLIENYPRASFIVLDKAAHDVQIKQEIIFNALITEWLERVKESN
jgi:pimeloyl-ACP methyl ester carboxylesterase